MSLAPTSSVAGVTAPPPEWLKRDHPFRYIGPGHCDTHERPSLYQKGGLHPVLLGDILSGPSMSVSNPQKRSAYRVVMKLGYGAFSTVWLARDVKSERFVAIKILEASRSFLSKQAPCEGTILESLQTATNRNGRHSAVLELIDSFIVEGPNGNHDCLVTEVVASLSGVDKATRCSPRVLRQVIDGFAHLHELGIVHGDPHPTNFGVASPLIQTLTEDRIESVMGTPETIPLVSRDSSFPRDSAPAYIVEIVNETFDFLLTHTDTLPKGEDAIIKILDFGRACKVNEIHSLPGGVPYPYRPPEVFMFEQSQGQLGDMWSTAADVWSVACVMYSIIAGHELISTWGSVDTIFSRCLGLGGDAPNSWLENWNLRESSESQVSQPSGTQEAWSAKKANIIRIGGISSARVDIFIDLIRHMIVTRPENRWTMAQVLEHPFFDQASTSAL